MKNHYFELEKTIVEMQNITGQSKRTCQRRFSRIVKLSCKCSKTPIALYSEWKRRFMGRLFDHVLLEEKMRRVMFWKRS